MDGVGALGMATLRELTEILFRVERAHWCYQDDICAQDSALPDLDFQAFATHVFANVPGVELCQACVRREVGRMAGVQVPCCMTCACRGWCQHLALPSRPPNTHACARAHTQTHTLTPPSLSLSLCLTPSLTLFFFHSLSLSLTTTTSALSPLENDVAVLLRHLRRVKAGTRACGAVILNANLDKCLLVRGGKSTRASFGWPKGKVWQRERARERSAIGVGREGGG